MTCRAPLYGVRQQGSGNKPQIYSEKPKDLLEAYELLELPCGRCRGCRMKKRWEWGVRCTHEAAYIWEEFSLPSTFITLTYDDANLPIDGSLVPKHLQDFIKRFRRRIEPDNIRYYACGEYGSKCPKHELQNCPMCGPIQRPHYHALIFGWAFPDRQEIGCREGLPVYESDFLNQLWPYGLHEIGSVTIESANYVAGYIMKKITGNKAHEHYQRYCPLRDTWYHVEPEFHHMSKKPGIGLGWLGKYKDDVYPSDECPIPGRGVHGTPPKYYDKFAEIWGIDMDAIKAKRRKKLALSLLEGPGLLSRAIVQDAEIARFRGKL